MISVNVAQAVVCCFSTVDHALAYLQFVLAKSCVFAEKFGDRHLSEQCTAYATSSSANARLLVKHSAVAYEVRGRMRTTTGHLRRWKWRFGTSSTPDPQSSRPRLWPAQARFKSLASAPTITTHNLSFLLHLNPQSPITFINHKRNISPSYPSDLYTSSPSYQSASQA